MISRHIVEWRIDIGEPGMDTGQPVRGLAQYPRPEMMAVCTVVSGKTVSTVRFEIYFEDTVCRI